MANSDPITIYFTATGEIKGNAYKDNGVAPAMEPGEAYVDGYYDRDDYYIMLPSLTPTPRPYLIELADDDTYTISISVGVNQTIISNMPIGTIVNGPDNFYGVTTIVENLQVRAERGGEFPFEIIPPHPYRDQEFTLVIDDAS